MSKKKKMHDEEDDYYGDSDPEEQSPEDELTEVDGLGLDPVDGEADDEGLELTEWEGEDGWDEEDERAETGELEAPAYVDNQDETISDSRNRLMWLKTDSLHEYGYGINWYEAHDFCESLNEQKFAGFDDWRMPGFEEAKTLFSFTHANTDKDGAEIHIDPLFASGGGHNTWTYDEKPDYHQYALKFSYVTGNEIWENKDNELSHVRPVRDEKKTEWEPEWRKTTKKFRK